MGFTNEIRRETAIDATAEEVWDILSDLRRYPEWNPGFTAIEGRAEVGTTLDVTFAPNAKGRSMTMHPIVLAADPGRELRWRGRLLLPFACSTASTASGSTRPSPAACASSRASGSAGCWCRSSGDSSRRRPRACSSAPTRRSPRGCRRCGRPRDETDESHA